MKQISYSAPGKVILSGEHAVVYGKPAIVCAIDKRLTLTLTPTLKTKYTDTVMPIIEATVRTFIEHKKITIKKIGYEYSITSDIPIGRGLGSSAAYSAVVAAGLLELFTGKEWSRDDINICAYKIEKYFHKNSSGADTSTSVMGGLLYYRKEFEFLKTISSLTAKIPKNITDSLLLIDTGKPSETTGEMVEKVGKLYNSNPSKTETLLNTIEKITKKLVISLMKEDKALFTETMQKNEVALEKIGVVSPFTKKLLSNLKKYGCGKITGGGGYEKASGYLLFSTENMSNLKKVLEQKSIIYLDFVPSYTGLKKEL